MKKVLVSSLIAAAMTAGIAVCFDITGTMKITAAVMMYYNLWFAVYGVWDWVEEKIKRRKRS